MSERTIYKVAAIPWEHGLELHVEGMGVTQSKNLDDAEEQVRDYIIVTLDVPEDSFDVEITLRPPMEEA